MDTISLSLAPESEVLSIRVYANVDNNEESLCATSILIRSDLIQIPDDTWNIIVEIGE